jgi:hypothetical protein
VSGPTDSYGTAASSPMELIRALALVILASILGRRGRWLAVVHGLKRKLYPWRKAEGLR